MLKLVRISPQAGQVIYLYDCDLKPLCDAHSDVSYFVYYMYFSLFLSVVHCCCTLVYMLHESSYILFCVIQNKRRQQDKNSCNLSLISTQRRTPLQQRVELSATVHTYLGGKKTTKDYKSTKQRLLDFN